MSLTIIVFSCCILELVIESYLLRQKDEKINILFKSDCSISNGTNNKCEQECMMDTLHNQLKIEMVR